MFSQQQLGELPQDSQGCFFHNCNGFLFCYILDYMQDLLLMLPQHFPECSHLQGEAKYFQLPEMARPLAQSRGQLNGDSPCTTMAPSALSSPCPCLEIWSHLKLGPLDSVLIGSIAGGAVVFIIFLALLIYCIRKKRAERYEEQNN
ncbi:unnamed protein product [Lepidochelys kempii]